MNDYERSVLASLVIVLLGDDKKRGLLPRWIDGGYHLERCQIGMYLAPGDGQRGGQPCSPRCREAREAALDGLELLEAEQPVQLPLDGAAGTMGRAAG